VAYLLLAT